MKEHLTIADGDTGEASLVDALRLRSAIPRRADECISDGRDASIEGAVDELVREVIPLSKEGDDTGDGGEKCKHCSILSIRT